MVEEEKQMRIRTPCTNRTRPFNACVQRPIVMTAAVKAATLRQRQALGDWMQ